MDYAKYLSGERDGDLENQVRSLLKEKVVPTRHWSAVPRSGPRSRWKQLLTLVIESLLTVHQRVSEQQAVLDTRVRALAKTHQTTRRLMTLPGRHRPPIAAKACI